MNFSMAMHVLVPDKANGSKNLANDWIFLFWKCNLRASQEKSQYLKNTIFVENHQYLEILLISAD